MAIKEIKREWSPCQLDYVKTYLLHSEKDVADLPKCCVGSKATVSETDNEYFCTVDGWKLSAEIEPGMGGGGSAGSGSSAPAEVVILPETTLEVVENGMADIKAMWEVDLAPDKVYIVSFNGTEYTCVANPAPAEMELPDGSVVFGGNMPDMGVTNGNSSAPFIAVGWPNSLAGEMGDMCGQVLPMDGTNVFTFSIVDASSGGNAGGGGSGVLVVTATLDMENMSMNDDQTQMSAPCTFDKTYDEVVSAANAGQYVICKTAFGSTVFAPLQSIQEEMIAFGMVMGTAMDDAIALVNVTIGFTTDNNGTFDFLMKTIA